MIMFSSCVTSQRTYRPSFHLARLLIEGCYHFVSKPELWSAVTAVLFDPLQSLVRFIHPSVSKGVLPVQVFRSRGRRPKTVASLIGDPTIIVTIISGIPFVSFASLLLTAVCTVVFVMVGMLCLRAWRYAAEGASYIGSLKGEKLSKGGTDLSLARYG
jgi:hypothetical protein